MRETYILGIGATAVGEHYGLSLSDLGSEALRNAVTNAGSGLDHERIGALYVANALSETMASQSHLGPLMADAVGLTGIEALRIEAAGASGGVALRQALLAVASGTHDCVVVLGVEKITDRLDGALEAALAIATHSDHEADQGITLTAQWAMLMRRYMYEHGYEAAAFAPFPINAHANGAKTPGALYRFAINADKYRKANQIASPLNMLDCSTVSDGAAAIVIASGNIARELSGSHVRIAGSALATDTLGVANRRDPLWLGAVERSTQAALRQAGCTHQDVDVLELTDPHGITAALALEAGGFVARGQAPRYAADGGIGIEGATPLATAGGYKARGDIAGASGIYQAVELVRQLRGQAGATQVKNARIGLAQNIGGIGATVVTHLLVAE